MSKRSKRMLSLLLGAGLVLIAPEALAWSWNQQPRPYNGFGGYSPGYGSSAGYGYQPEYPRGHRGAYRPRYYGYGYGRYHQWPRYGHYRYFPAYRYFPGCRY
jgi:opacity protein-like surface antigen